MNKALKRILLTAFILAILCYVVLDDLLQGNWGLISGSWSNLSTFWNESLWPPEWSMLEARKYPECQSSIGFFCSKAYIGMLETLKMAFVSTVVGFFIAILLSPFAAKNLTSAWVYIPMRIVLAATRSLPSIIWAIIFVVIVGLGPLAGVLAMTFYTVGYLGKLQYEEMEGVQNSPLEAARAMGLSHPEIVTNVVIPESSNNLLSQLLFMFEYNVRHGSVLGLVGAGGIGYYLQFYMGLLMYQNVMAFLIVILVVVIVIDLISMYIRSFVTEDGDVKRPSWSTIFLSPNKATEIHHGNSEEE
ncbi:MAG: phosphonate ABC transporter, permease protein PhnE [Euryarchaeota archaeon]|nr:phosphonate ABC transporter, permease protein PhnE [Euryarchaeota archaeon]